MVMHGDRARHSSACRRQRQQGRQRNRNACAVHALSRRNVSDEKLKSERNSSGRKGQSETLHERRGLTSASWMWPAWRVS